MKWWMKILITLVVMVTIIYTVGPKPPTPTEILERITKDVNLTEVQQKQFKAFLDTQETKPRPTEKERNSRGEKDRKEMDAKLKVILTQAQYAKWQEIKSKRKQQSCAWFLLSRCDEVGLHKSHHSLILRTFIGLERCVHKILS